MIINEIVLKWIKITTTANDACRARELKKQLKVTQFVAFQVLPQFVFNSRDPIVMGVIVEAGIVKEGTPICVPSKGVSTSNHYLKFLVSPKTQREKR